MPRLLSGLPHHSGLQVLDVILTVMAPLMRLRSTFWTWVNRNILLWGCAVFGVHLFRVSQGSSSARRSTLSDMLRAL
jgi:hypothetical protein